ncbi:MAG: toll/interleukin-1 receptor domain-containing protein [Chloroflexi bacterium]|nr:MAG: toll/interleukin-1 receptor domain-containing protein [Chloroflexota bacterium]
MDKNLKIFINYRRSDNPCFAERIRDWFLLRYARENVFMDFDAIPPFVKFEDFILDYLNQTDVMLVIIGRNWVNLLKEKAANNEQDFVKLEIMTALRNNILIAPICVDGAAVPDEDDLPDELKPMLDFNVAFLQGGRHFLDNIERLIDALPVALAQHRRMIASVEERAAMQPAPKMDDLVHDFVGEAAYEAEESDIAFSDVNPPSLQPAMPPAPASRAARRAESQVNQPYIAVCNVPADEAIKQRLVDDLRQAGYAIRTDDEALTNAALVLILVSPEARRDGYISHTIAETQAANVPLIPVLVAGDMESALPYAVSAAQIIHLENEYDTGLNALKNLLPLYLK